MTTVFQLLRRWFEKYQKDRCSLLASAIAYRALFSIIPVTALLVAVVSRAVRIPEVERQVVDSVIERIPIDRGLVTDSLRAISGTSEPLSIISAILLLWAAMGIFTTLRETLNIVWGVSPRGLVKQRLVDIVSIFGLGVLVVLSISGTAALHSLGGEGMSAMGDLPRTRWLLELVSAVIPATVTFLAFLFVYRYVPYVLHSFDDVFPGAVLGAIFFEAAKHGFAWYVANFSNSEVYGALGTVMVFQLWVYVSANILLAGAVLNAVLRAQRIAPPPHVDPTEGKGL